MKWLMIVPALLVASVAFAQNANNGGNPHGPGGSTGPKATCNSQGIDDHGQYNVTCPHWGAKGDCSTDDEPAILAAFNAACAAAASSVVNYTPVVSLPYGSCYKINEPLLLTCAHQVQVIGDSDLSIWIGNGTNHFPTIVTVPSTYATQSIGTISAPSLVTGSGAAMNFPSATPYYYNPSDVMTNPSSPGAYPLNGLSQLDVRGFFKLTNLTTFNYVFFMGGSNNGSNVGAITELLSQILIDSTGRFCFALTTGGTTHGNCTAGGTITAGTLYEFEMAYNGSNLYAFLNGTQVAGSPIVATGTVTETAYSQILIGAELQDYPEWGNEGSGNSFIGQMDSYQISNVARHTANYTQDTTKFSNDANTLLLLNGKAFNNPLMEADSAYGATDGWLIARGHNGAQGAAINFKNLTIAGGTIGLFRALEPSAKEDNLTFANELWIGEELWNNDYEGFFDHPRYTMPNTSEAAISASGANGVEKFYGPTIVTQGYHGIEGFDLAGTIRDPFIAPGPTSVDGLYVQQDNGFENLSVDNMAVDAENGGSATGPLLIGGGKYVFTHGDVQTGTTAPCIEIQPVANSGGSALLGVTLVGMKCETIAGSAPAELVDFLGSNNPVTPVTWIDPNVNLLPYSQQTAIPWTNTPANLVVYGDVMQPPVKTVSTLPTCNSGAKGELVQISDCNANCTTYLGTTFTGGGSTRSTVQCNGTNWELH